MPRIRYALRVMNPKTNQLSLSATAKTFSGITKKMTRNLLLNPEYYTNEASKPLRMKLTAEQKEGKTWQELEEYKITKEMKIHGYFTNWEKM